MMSDATEKDANAGGTIREEFAQATMSRPRTEDGQERGFKINNLPADAVSVKRSEARNGDLRFDVEFAHQGNAVGRLKDLNLDELEIAVGDKNTRVIVLGKEQTHLQGSQLEPHDGLSPKELDRQIIEKEDRKRSVPGPLDAGAVAQGIKLTLPSAADTSFDKRNPNAIANASPPQAQRIESEDILPELREKLPRPVPPSIADRYLQVGERFYDNRREERTPAFTDRGDKFSTARHDDQVARDMVEMARARGWEKIELKGNEEFRRAAWVAAEEKGVQTKGYTPTEKEIETAANRRSAVEAVETTNITRDGELPANFRERAKTDPEALKAAGIQQLAKEVAKHLLDDPTLRARFVRTVEHRLEEHLKGDRPLPNLKLRNDQERERSDDGPREHSQGR
jgi:hypothetical protein